MFTKWKTGLSKTINLNYIAKFQVSTNSMNHVGDEFRAPSAIISMFFPPHPNPNVENFRDLTCALPHFVELPDTGKLAIKQPFSLVVDESRSDPSYSFQTFWDQFPLLSPFKK